MLPRQCAARIHVAPAPRSRRCSIPAPGRRCDSACDPVVRGIDHARSRRRGPQGQQLGEGGQDARHLHPLHARHTLYLRELANARRCAAGTTGRRPSRGMVLCGRIRPRRFLLPNTVSCACYTGARKRGAGGARLRGSPRQSGAPLRPMNLIRIMPA